MSNSGSPATASGNQKRRDRPSKKSKSEASPKRSKVSDEIVDHSAPVDSFDCGLFPKRVLKTCSEAGFSKPTRIQGLIWSAACAGRDVIGVADTGSGKTLAFGLPLLTRVHSLAAHHPVAVVVSPTRELAQQTEAVLTQFGAPLGVTSVCMTGGVSRQSQVKELRAGAQIVVATPGRCLDLLESGDLDLSRVSIAVLDEADRLLDQGFEEPIRAILKACNSAAATSPQMLLFTATWRGSGRVQKLGEEFTCNPLQVRANEDVEGECASPTSTGHDVEEGQIRASKSVTQIVEVMSEANKEQRLLELLKEHHSSRKNKVLVFALYKKEADRVEGFLNRRGWRCASLHGDKAQSERTQVILNFKSGGCPLLVATDVAARGLDVDDVEFVINYTFPLTIEDYVHRIGRTGRAGAKGTAFTFYTDIRSEKQRAGELVEILEEAGQPVPAALRAFGPAIVKGDPKPKATGPRGGRLTFESDSD